MKNKRYYIVWVEGLSCRYGEKILGVTDNGFTYTTMMKSSLRIRKNDISLMKDLMRRFGLAEWVIRSNNTFIPTSYLPTGTLYKFTK